MHDRVERLARPRRSARGRAWPAVASSASADGREPAGRARRARGPGRCRRAPGAGASSSDEVACSAMRQPVALDPLAVVVELRLEPLQVSGALGQPSPRGRPRTCRPTASRRRGRPGRTRLRRSAAGSPARAAGARPGRVEPALVADHDPLRLARAGGAAVAAPLPHRTGSLVAPRLVDDLRVDDTSSVGVRRHAAGRRPGRRRPASACAYIAAPSCLAGLAPARRPRYGSPRRRCPRSTDRSSPSFSSRSALAVPSGACRRSRRGTSRSGRAAPRPGCGSRPPPCGGWSSSANCSASRIIRSMSSLGSARAAGDGHRLLFCRCRGPWPTRARCRWRRCRR